jgi:hypothetical protein
MKASLAKLNKKIIFSCTKWFNLYEDVLVDMHSIFQFCLNKNCTRREPLTMGKQLVNFITCDCESSAPYFVIYKAGREPMQYW